MKSFSASSRTLSQITCHQTAGKSPSVLMPHWFVSANMSRQLEQKRASASLSVPWPRVLTTLLTPWLMRRFLLAILLCLPVLLAASSAMPQRMRGISCNGIKSSEWRHSERRKAFLRHQHDFQRGTNIRQDLIFFSVHKYMSLGYDALFSCSCTRLDVSH